MHDFYILNLDSFFEDDANEEITPDLVFEIALIPLRRSSWLTIRTMPNSWISMDVL